MIEIKTQLTNTKEQYYNEYIYRFDRSQTLNTLQNNVLLVAELQLKLAEELVEKTNEHYKNNAKSLELEEFRNDLYLEFVQFSTTFEG